MKKPICRNHVWVLEALFSEGGWVTIGVALTRKGIREQKNGVNWEGVNLPWLRIRKYYSEDIK